MFSQEAWPNGPVLFSGPLQRPKLAFPSGQRPNDHVRTASAGKTDENEALTRFNLKEKRELHYRVEREHEMQIKPRRASKEGQLFKIYIYYTIYWG